jgi:hypothetical protein
VPVLHRNYFFKSPMYMAFATAANPADRAVCPLSPLPCKAWHGYGAFSAHHGDMRGCRRACERTPLRGRRRCAAGGQRDHGVSAMRGHEAGYSLLEHDVRGGSDAPCNRIVHTVACGVRGVANHHTTESFFAELAAQLIGDQPNTRNLDASGSTSVRRVRGTPPESPTARLKVRLRRKTTVMTAQDHIAFGTDMLYIMADALSRIVRQGRSALPSM